MNEQSAPEAGGATTKAAIRVQREDGSWQELTPKPLSEDPAVNAIGNLTPDEIKVLLADEEHPDHAAAVEYNRLLGLRLRRVVDTALKSIQLSPEVATSLGRFRKVQEDFVKRLAPTLQMSKVHGDFVNLARTIQMPKAFAESYAGLTIDRTPAVDVAALKDLDVELPSARTATYDLVDGQQETNELLHRAVEAMAVLAAHQEQLLELERGKTAAAEVREEAAHKEAAHNKLGMWLGVGVGAVGVVVSVIAILAG